MYQVFKGLFITLILCVLTIPVQAQEVKNLTLEQAQELAIQNNPQLKAAQARLDVSKAAVVTAGARLNPSILSDNGIAEDTYRLGLEQTIELGGKRRKRMSVAQAQQGVVTAEVKTVLLTLRSNVRRSYTQLYNAQQREKAHQDILTTSQKLVNVARKRERVGDISNFEVLQPEIASINAKNELQTVHYQTVEAQTRLSMLMNQPLPVDVILTPPPVFSQAPTTVPQPAPSGAAPLQGSVTEAVASLEALLKQAYANRPELQQNRQQVAVTHAQLALAKANRIPNLRIAAGPDLVTGAERKFSAFIIGMVELPILNRQQGPILEALAQQRQLDQEQAATRNQIRYEVMSAHTALVANQERIKNYETELLPKAAEVAEKARRSFEVGKSPILVPLAAQQAYTNTRLGYLQALTELQNAISDLEKAIGTGL
ncbi:MAG: hypothetical protein K0Q50_1148 [Vampirovibrio sp.]|nr:hypothetical protein [Vampirovibrio sp.]